MLVVLGMTVHGDAPPPELPPAEPAIREGAPVIRPAVQIDSMKPAMVRSAAQQIA
jgi:hypothetical protein